METNPQAKPPCHETNEDTPKIGGDHTLLNIGQRKQYRPKAQSCGKLYYIKVLVYLAPGEQADKRVDLRMKQVKSSNAA
jgi:hypothetical protein